jgi:RNA polymerase sigma factor (sigma-70 family)
VESTQRYKEIDDLVLRAQRGDETALAELQRTYRKLIAACLRRCLNKLPDLERFREDLEMEAPLIFRQVVSEYDPELSYFSYYLPKFFDYALLAHAKKVYIKEAAHLSVDSLSIDIEDDRQSDPFGKLLDNMELSRALANLGEKQRCAVTLYFFEGLTQEEAAKKIGITQASFCKRLQRALAALKDELS